MYLGGNGLNCEVEFLDDATMRFKTYSPSAASAACRPENPAWLREPLPSHASRAEANLLGVVFDRRGIMTAAPYRVAGRRPLGLRGHRSAGRRPLRRGEPARAVSRRRVRPRDRQDARRTRPPNTVLLAKGTQPRRGRRGDGLLRDRPSGGAVFSVGSITYPARCWSTTTSRGHPQCPGAIL